MRSLNMLYNKLRKRSADQSPAILFSDISKSEVEQNENKSHKKAFDVTDSFIWTSSRSRPAPPFLMGNTNKKVKILTEQTSALELLSAQENDGYISEEGENTDEWNSTTIIEVITNNCKQDNDLNYVQELLNNLEIRKILHSRRNTQNTLDCAEEVSEFPPHEIVDDTICVSYQFDECSDAKPMSRWTEMDEVDLKAASFDPVPHIFEPPQLREHNSTITNDGNFNVKKEFSGNGKVIKYPENIELITITKSHDPLGLTISKKENSLLISRIIYGGLAATSGLFREGDEIIAVNGEDVRNHTIDEVNEKMRGMTGEVSFIVAPSTNVIFKTPSFGVHLLHFKANFSYDPETDMRPCPDLGISFQKGDILHVIDQRDPKWWQAYRDDEQDQPLAGIIPSREHQICVEKVLRKMKTEGKERNKILSLRRKSSDQKEEDYEPYIAVDVYWPRQGYKRPVALVGVPNIGIQDICKKFMDFPERYSAAIPRTTREKLEREVDGVDYHFVSKSQFEAGITAGKFVEYGKYDKHYYGTTFDAIWTIANSGMTCILNISLSSMKALIKSGLMPYIVLISPPSLERLKQKKQDRGEIIKEKNLVKIIDESRELEETFDQYIDSVLINRDEEETFQEIVRQINVIERDPQWLPSSWINGSFLSSEMSLTSVC